MDDLTHALESRCDQARLVDAMRDLLGLYFVPNETEAIRARQIALFVKDLSEFSDEIAHKALEQWRREQDRRPTPAALRQMAMVVRRELWEARASKSRPVIPREEPREVDIDPATAAERKAIAERVLKSFGYKERQGRYVSQTAIEAEQAEAEARLRHWSETAGPDDPRWVELRRAREANKLYRQATR